MKKLPNTVFIKMEKSDSGPYLVASADKYGLAEMGEKIKIGTYELVKVENVEVVLRTDADQN